MKIILASKSPRRKELLNLLQVEYEVMESKEEEILLPELTIEEQSKRLAYEKAKNVFNRTTGDRIVIGADTLVWKEGKIYGKPKNREEAVQMLQELKNSHHNIITGLCILMQKNGEYKQYVDIDKAEIYIGDMTEKEIENWLNTGHAMDKAGAYAIQQEFAIYVEKIIGNYSSCMGLPIHKVYEIMKKWIE